MAPIGIPMNHEPNDPESQHEVRATAYVFGELDDQELQAFEDELSASVSLQETVTAIREAVFTLQEHFELQTEGVSDVQRDQIESAMDDAVNHQSAESVSPHPSSGVADGAGNKRWLVSLSVAAVLLIAVGLSVPAVSDAWKSGEKISQYENQIPLSRAENQALSKELSQQPEVERPIAKREIGERVVDFASAMAPQVEAPEVEGRSTDELVMGTDTETSSPVVRDKDSSGKKASDLSSVAERSANESTTVAQSRSVQASAKPQTNDSRVDAEPAALGVEEQHAGAARLAAERLLVEEKQLAEIREQALRQKTLDELKQRATAISEKLSVSEAKQVESAFRRVTVGTTAHNSVSRGARVRFETDQLESLVKRAHEARLQPAWAVEKSGGDRFQSIQDNRFHTVEESPLSTFSIDVDTAAYSKLRMYLQTHQRLPDPNAIRIEELVNYFRYDYEPPADDTPFAAAMDIASCPWNPKHRLARIGIKGKVIEKERPPSNLVFLLDVSGSMNRPNKHPLVIKGMKMLVDQLTENDSVAIVVYAGAAGMVLDSTTGDKKKVIIDSLDRLRAGGSTNGAHGIQLAYQVARDHFIPGGTNRVILCTDGDFNVGVTGTEELVDIAAENAKGDIFLSVLGFGIGNHNDAMMEQVSNRGNGNYAFIDNEQEARKVFVEQMKGTLITIAKDVKIQIEFNPTEVNSYRLIGYENRVLAAEDFNDDKKDAGEIGAGHTVTALYEIVPAKMEQADGDDPATPVDPLKYQRRVNLSEKAESGETLTLKLRYKEPTADKSKLLEFPITDKGQLFNQVDRDFQFAAAVAAFGMILRDSPHKGEASFSLVEELAATGAEKDPSGYRDEFVSLVKIAKGLAP